MFYVGEVVGRVTHDHHYERVYLFITIHDIKVFLLIYVGEVLGRVTNRS